MDRAHKSVDELKGLGESIKQTSKDKSATVADAARASFHRVQSALEALKESGRAYDQKFKVRLIMGKFGGRQKKLTTEVILCFSHRPE